MMKIFVQHLQSPLRPHPEPHALTLRSKLEASSLSLGPHPEPHALTSRKKQKEPLRTSDPHASLGGWGLNQAVDPNQLGLET